MIGGEAGGRRPETTRKAKPEIPLKAGIEAKPDTTKKAWTETGSNLLCLLHVADMEKDKQEKTKNRGYGVPHRGYGAMISGYYVNYAVWLCGKKGKYLLF